MTKSTESITVYDYTDADLTTFDALSVDHKIDAHEAWGDTKPQKGYIDVGGELHHLRDYDPTTPGTNLHHLGYSGVYVRDDTTVYLMRPAYPGAVRIEIARVD